MFQRGTSPALDAQDSAARSDVLLVERMVVEACGREDGCHSCLAADNELAVPVLDTRHALRHNRWAQRSTPAAGASQAELSSAVATSAIGVEICWKLCPESDQAAPLHHMERVPGAAESAAVCGPPSDVEQ